MKLVLNAYILADNEGALIVRGNSENKCIATAIEPMKKRLPILYREKSYAEMALKRKDFDITPSAKTYCIQYRMPYKNPKLWLKPRAVTVTIEG